MKNNKKDILHFSINTTQVPCCTHMDLTSLYFSKNNISIDKGCSLPLTQSFAVQLICLDHDSLFVCMSVVIRSAHCSLSERLRSIHAITAQAIEEERTRRDTLLRLRSSQSDESWIISSYQYRDLLSVDLDMFNSPRPVVENHSEHDSLSESLISTELVSEPHSVSPTTEQFASPLLCTLQDPPTRDESTSEEVNSLLVRPSSPTPSSPLSPQTPSSPPSRPSSPLFHSASEGMSKSNTIVTAKLRKFGSQHVADPYNDRFAHRIPFLKQMSLSYGEDECTNTMTLSVQLPPQKEKGKKRDLTIHEKEILSKEGCIPVVS